MNHPSASPTMRPPRRLAWRRGVTLIELLMSLAIISVLLGLTLPVVSSVRRSARATQCLAQMRGLAQSLAAYIEGNRRFPLSEELTWLERGATTMPRLFDQWTPGAPLPQSYVCPDDRAVRAPGQASYRYGAAATLRPLWKDWLYTPTTDHEGVESPTSLLRLYADDQNRFLWIERRPFHRRGARDTFAEEQTFFGKLDEVHVAKIDGSAFKLRFTAPASFSR